MDTIEAIFSRHSVRGFKSDPVPKETILKILEAANQAPSTANTQPWQLYVAGGEVLDKIRKVGTARYMGGESPEYDVLPFNDWPPVLKALIDKNRGERFRLLGIDRQNKEALKANQALNYQFFGAPVAVFICMERTLGALSIFDMGAVAQTIMIAARNYGVDSIPALNFVPYPDLLHQELQIPDNLMLVLGIALGYADPDNPINKFRSYRRPIQEAVTFRGI
jgi:nitroreductase